jgi:hypothetical protein
VRRTDGQADLFEAEKPRSPPINRATPPVLNGSVVTRSPPIEPFDFLADADAACYVPRPDWIIPEWLKLPGVDD